MSTGNSGQASILSGYGLKYRLAHDQTLIRIFEDGSIAPAKWANATLFATREGARVAKRNLHPGPFRRTLDIVFVECVAQWRVV